MLGDLTRQIAKQAIGDTVKDIIDPQAAPAGPVEPGAAVIAEMQTIQKALKEDDELVVLYPAGGEMIRIFEIYVPAGRGIAVLSGLDPQKARTRVVVQLGALELVCKTFKVAPGGKAARVLVK